MEASIKATTTTLVVNDHCADEPIYDVDVDGLFECLFFMYRLYDATVPQDVVDACQRVSDAWTHGVREFGYECDLLYLNLDIYEYDAELDTDFSASSRWDCKKSYWEMCYRAANGCAAPRKDDAEEIEAEPLNVASSVVDEAVNAVPVDELWNCLFYMFGLAFPEHMDEDTYAHLWDACYTVSMARKATRDGSYAHTQSYRDSVAYLGLCFSGRPIVSCGGAVESYPDWKRRKIGEMASVIQARS